MTAGPDPSVVLPPLESATVTCGACQHVNAATRRFCTNCGQGLLQVCPDCGTPSRVGERFCGNCGANIVAGNEALTEQFDAHLQQARQLCDERSFDEALALLASITSVQYSYLTDRLAEARRLLEEATAQRAAWLEQANEAYRAAQADLEGQDLVAAFGRLEEIPPSVRGEAFNDLYQQVRGRFEKLRQAERDIAQAVQARSIDGLLPHVKELLELQPHHAQGLALAQHFARRLERSARKLLAEGKYGDALAALDEVPPPVRDEQFPALRQKLAELAWLAEDLRLAPAVDQPLVAIADRFKALVPKDARAAKLAEEVRRRAGLIAKSTRTVVPPWSKRPDTSPLGPPVDWMTGFRHIDIQAVREQPSFLEQPGRYYVACGLALQGLGQAPLQTDLLPTDERTVLGRIAKMMPRRNARAAWGLDLGSSGIKAVQLTWDESQGRIALKNCETIEFRKPLSQASDGLESQTILRDALDLLLKRHDLKNDRVSVCLPGGMVLHRMLKIPAIPNARIENIVQVELRQQFPKLQGDLISAYHVIELPTVEGKPPSGYDVVLVVARRTRLKTVYEGLQEAGIGVSLMQSDCLALHNFLSYEYRVAATVESDDEQAAETQQGLAVLDVGGDTANLVISSPPVVWLQSFGFGSDRFTRAIAQELQLSYSDAEALKRTPDKAASYHELYQVLEPLFREFSEELGRTLENFSRTHALHRITRLMVLGGGMQLHGLLRHLRVGK